MDLFKRIQDLSDLYDGPSATVQGSRPMFNDGGMLVQPSNDGSRPGYNGDFVKTGPGTSRRTTFPQTGIKKIEYKNKAGKINTKYQTYVYRNKKNISGKPADSLSLAKKNLTQLEKDNPKKIRSSGLDSTRPKPALDRFSDALVKANAEDDIKYILQKTKGVPEGKLSSADHHNINYFKGREDDMQYLSKKSGLEIDEIFDLIEDGEAYVELEAASIRQTEAAKTRKPKSATERQEFYKKAEDWFTTNAKRYDDPDKFKKAFDRTFGKNNILAKDLKRSKNSFFVPFSNDFKREFFGTGLGMTKGGKTSTLDKPITDPKKLANIFYTPSQLDTVFKTTIYNLNPKVRKTITDEFKSILPKEGSTSIQRYEASRGFKESNILKKFGLDRKIQGPISRLIFKEIGEDLFQDISLLRNPQMRTTSLIRYLRDKVDPKYKSMFKEALSSIESAQQNQWADAKSKLKLSEDIMFDHKIPANLIEKGYADEINYIKATPTPKTFNAQIKNYEFDRPIGKLATKYALEKDPTKKKLLMQEMLDLKNDFSSRHGGYLDDIKIKDVKGQPLFESKDKPISKKTNLTFELEKNLKMLNPKHQQLIKDQFCTNRKGGQPGSCSIGEAMDNMIKQTNAVKQGAIKGTEATRIANKASKVVRFGTGKGLGAVLGPLGLGAEAVFEVGMAVPGYGKGESGKRLLGDSILGLIPGVGQSAEEEFDEYATKDGMSQLEQQKIKDANRFLELNNSLPSALKNIGKGGRGNPLAGSETFEKQYNEYEPLYNQFVGGPPSESASTALAEQRRINDLINADKAIRAEQRDIAMDEDFMAAGGGIAKMAGDRSGAMTRSMNPDSQGLSYLFNRVKKV